MPDNLKSGIAKTCRYEPDANPTYAEMARHYGVAVIPVRVRKLRDKALTEISVQIAERWTLARLRHRQFFTLAELNAAIRSLVLRLNTKPFRKRSGSRSGTATFLAGGEVPIPVSAGFGAVLVTYKNYGVKLNIQPDVDRQGNILANIKTEISEINPALTVQGYLWRVSIISAFSTPTANWRSGHCGQYHRSAREMWSGAALPTAQK